MPSKTKHILDARGQILGRLATEIADLLRGKGKVEFERHEDNGDWVTVINAKEIKVTGNKLEDKLYSRHSGYHGGLTQIQLKTLLEKSPGKVIQNAVRGMLPKNRLQNGWLLRLKVYAGEER